MLRSIQLYSRYFLKAAFSPAARYVIHDVKRISLIRKSRRQRIVLSSSEKRAALGKAVQWLITAQNSNNDGGMGSYHLINHWSSSYPETTGYIIPTLLAYAHKFNDDDAAKAAIRAAEFLLRIRKASGGWQGGRVNENKPEIVFNTGQVMRGMIAAYRETGSRAFLDAAAGAGDWLAGIQHAAGYWKQHALMNEARVYDTFVDVPLLELYGLTGDERHQAAALQNLDWVIRQKMLDNGWFEDCDNTIKRNDKPILHTIAYTLDGLIDAAGLSGNSAYSDAAMKGADILRDRFLKDGYLHGRYDRHWNGSEFMICTGGAQMASVWFKLFRLTGDPLYAMAARKMTTLLVTIQHRFTDEAPETAGAIPGSFPLWGRYEPFAFPNWATKFFCDALMLEEEMI